MLAGSFRLINVTCHLVGLEMSTVWNIIEVIIETVADLLEVLITNRKEKG